MSHLCVNDLFSSVTCHHPNLCPLGHQLPQAIYHHYYSNALHMDVVGQYFRALLQIFSPRRLTALPLISYIIPIEKNCRDSEGRNYLFKREVSLSFSPKSSSAAGTNDPLLSTQHYSTPEPTLTQQQDAWALSCCVV